MQLGGSASRYSWPEGLRARRRQAGGQFGVDMAARLQRCPPPATQMRSRLLIEQGRRSNRCARLQLAPTGARWASLDSGMHKRPWSCIHRPPQASRIV